MACQRAVARKKQCFDSKLSQGICSFYVNFPPNICPLRRCHGSVDALSALWTAWTLDSLSILSYCHKTSLALITGRLESWQSRHCSAQSHNGAWSDCPSMSQNSWRPSLRSWSCAGASPALEMASCLLYQNNQYMKGTESSELKILAGHIQLLHNSAQHLAHVGA